MQIRIVHRGYLSCTVSGEQVTLVVHKHRDCLATEAIFQTITIATRRTLQTRLTRSSETGADSSAAEHERMLNIARYYTAVRKKKKTSVQIYKVVMRNDQRADDSSRQRPVSIDVNAGQTTVPEDLPPLLNISYPL